MNSSKRRKRSTGCAINNLPDLIFVKIFEYLCAPERIRVERVCKKWKSLSLCAWTKYRCLRNDFYLYERRINVRKKKFKILPRPTLETSTDILKQLLSRGGVYVKSVDMLWTYRLLSRNILPIIARFCPNLEVIQCSSFTFTKSSLNSLTIYCNQLKSVKFDQCFSHGVNLDREFNNLFRNCIHLTSLDLNAATLTGRCFSNLPTEMKSLSIAHCDELENGAFRNLADRCSRLEELKLIECNQITIESLQYVFRNLAELRVFHFGVFEFVQGIQLSLALSTLNKLAELNLSRNEWVNDKILGNISSGCCNLESLDITFCENVTDVGMNYLRRLQRLNHLKMNYCDLVTNEGVKALAILGRLQALEFRTIRDKVDDDLVMQLANHCANLKTLILSNCAEVSNVSVQMLARLCLEVLELSGCEQIEDDTVKILTERCPNLIKLNLSKSEISDDGVKMLGNLNRLKVLLLSHCQNISDDSMVEFAKCCPNLELLYIAFCRNVTVASVLAFRNNASKRKVRLYVYIPETGVHMKFKNAKMWSQAEDDRSVFIHPLLKIVNPVGFR